MRFTPSMCTPPVPLPAGALRAEMHTHRRQPVNWPRQIVSMGASVTQRLDAAVSQYYSDIESSTLIKWGMRFPMIMMLVMLLGFVGFVVAGVSATQNFDGDGGFPIGVIVVFILLAVSMFGFVAGSCYLSSRGSSEVMRIKEAFQGRLSELDPVVGYTLSVGMYSLTRYSPAPIGLVGNGRGGYMWVDFLPLSAQHPQAASTFAPQYSPQALQAVGQDPSYYGVSAPPTAPPPGSVVVTAQATSAYPPIVNTQAAAGTTYSQSPITKY